MKGLLVVIWLTLVPVAWAITTITWDISQAGHPEKSYHGFLQSLRDQVKDPKEKAHEIPVMRKPTTSKADNENFVLVELTASKDISITLSLAKSDLYLMGYSDKFMDKKVEKCRHHVFKDQDAKCKAGAGDYKRCGLCDGVAKAKEIGQPINYRSLYMDIEKNTPGKSRKKTGLGFGKLKGWVEVVYGSEIKGKANLENEAQFLLTAIQMVSEATRFLYIQNKVPAAYKGVYNPDDRVLCYENKWSKASKLIKTTPAPTKQKPDFVIDIDCWVFSSVAEIQKDIALLCYNCKDDATTLSAAAVNKAAIDVDTSSNDVSIPNSLLNLEYGSHAVW